MKIIDNIVNRLAYRVASIMLPDLRNAYHTAVRNGMVNMAEKAAKAAIREAQAESVRGTAAACMSAGLPMDVRVGIDFNGVIGVVEPGEENRFKYVATYRVSA